MDEWTNRYWIGVGLVTTAAVVLVAIGSAYLIADNKDDIPGWVQAIGATISICLAVWVALWQHSRAVHAKREADTAALQAALAAEKAAAEAAYSMAHESLETVGDRLNVALGNSTEEFGLRALRTTEIIEAMRSVDTGQIPIALLKDFVKIRSRAYAMNARITELYRREDEATALARPGIEAKRHDKLASAVSTHDWALNAFRRLETAAFQKWQIAAVPLTPRPNIENYTPPPRLTGPSGQ
jgi:hypothetical protein